MSVPRLARPWWTEADQAELDLLTWELVDAMWKHKERCPTCSVRGQICEPIRRAGEAVLDWIRGRTLRSKALYLRELQDDLEAAAAGGKVAELSLTTVAAA